MVRSLLGSKAGRGAGKVSPRWVKLHTLSLGQQIAGGHCGGCDRTAPFVTAAINTPLQNTTDKCPSECFTANMPTCLQEAGFDIVMCWYL